MTDPAIEVLRSAREEYEIWVARLNGSPDPLNVSADSVRRLSKTIERAGAALDRQPAGDLASEEWRIELLAYREALNSLHRKLEHLGVSLIVRRSQLADAQAHKNAVKSWAELTQKLR